MILDDGDNKDEYAKVVVGEDEIIVCSCRFSYRWTKKGGRLRMKFEIMVNVLVT